MGPSWRAPEAGLGLALLALANWPARPANRQHHLNSRSHSHPLGAQIRERDAAVALHHAVHRGSYGKHNLDLRLLPLHCLRKVPDDALEKRLLRLPSDFRSSEHDLRGMGAWLAAQIRGRCDGRAPDKHDRRGALREPGLHIRICPYPELRWAAFPQELVSKDSPCPAGIPPARQPRSCRSAPLPACFCTGPHPLSSQVSQTARLPCHTRLLPRTLLPPFRASQEKGKHRLLSQIASCPQAARLWQAIQLSMPRPCLLILQHAFYLFAKLRRIGMPVLAYCVPGGKREHFLFRAGYAHAAVLLAWHEPAVRHFPVCHNCTPP